MRLGITATFLAMTLVLYSSFPAAGWGANCAHKSPGLLTLYLERSPGCALSDLTSVAGQTLALYSSLHLYDPHRTLSVAS